MNPFLILVKELLRNKIVLLAIGAATGVSTDQSLPFLAKVIHPNRVSERQMIINSARKERVALEGMRDSINEITNIYSKSEINQIEKDEEVNRNARIFTDVQLDSILTNYRYIPLTKE